MTYKEAASSMRRVADAIDAVVAERGDEPTGRPEPLLEGDFAVGAANLLVYLRDLITVGERETYDRGTLLVILETISRDDDIFPCGVAKVLWAAEEET